MTSMNDQLVERQQDALALLRAAGWEVEVTGRSSGGQLLVDARDPFGYRHRAHIDLHGNLSGEPVAAEPKTCGFCRGEPVDNGQSWIDGRPHPPAACPRCGMITLYGEHAGLR